MTLKSRQSLDLFPPEILHQILDDLESTSQDSIYDDCLRKQPYLDPSRGTARPPSSLKPLSLVSHALRQTVVTRLFRHTQLVMFPPQSAGTTSISRDTMFHRTNKLSQIARFLLQSNLGLSVRSFILRIVDGQGYYDVDWSEDLERDSTEDVLIRRHWQSFILAAPYLEKLTIIAPPFCLGRMVSIRLNPSISYSLHMPYQILSMQRGCTNNLKLEGNAIRHAEDIPSILSILDWTHLELNEGSFLRYHADRPQGWLHELLSADSVPNANSKFPNDLCARLEHFEYVAIFPTEDVIGNLLWCLKDMPLLQTFTFQTQPKDDMLPDASQRYIASFDDLELTRHEVYKIVLERLAKAAFLYRDLKHGSSLQKLRRIHCRDSDSDGVSYRDWQGCVSLVEIRGWKSFKLDNGEFGLYRGHLAI